MALFNKDESNTKLTTPKSSGNVISSIISTDMRVTGEIHFKGTARVDGTVEGNTKGEHLVLSETGKIFGDLELATLICHGSIEGNVKAQQVTAHSSSSIKGNLVATSLTVESGARLNGEVSSSTQPQPKIQPVSTPAKAEADQKDKSKS